MKKITFIIMLLLLLTACSDNVDKEYLDNLSESLENRWEFTNELPEEITISDLEKVTQIELDTLNKYNVDDFKDKELFVLYNNYVTVLDDMLYLTQNKTIDDPNLKDEWRNLLEIRSKILFDINSNYGIEVDDLEILDEVLKDAKQLVEMEEIEDLLKGINENIHVLIEDNSILIEYPIESVLSADSFVAQKTGFPGTAMDILNKFEQYDYDNVVISTINQNNIAISAYFSNSTLKEIDFSSWNEIDSYDGFNFYEIADDFYIRLGILEQLNDDTYNNITNINKNSNNAFWKKYGFSH